MKFNTVTKEKRITNYMGGKAYELTPEMELYTLVVAFMLQDSYYEKATDRLNRLKALVSVVDPVFIAKLAVYTREKMYLRTTPVVLIAELAKIHKGDNLVSKTIQKTVQRPDEITELLAYYQFMNARKQTKKLHKLSKQIQKGLSEAFNKFDAYQLAKYNRKGQVTLRDALFLVHPKAKDEAQQEIFNLLVKDELPVPYTWETELSALGQQIFESENAKEEAKATKWEELVASGKLGYMALLRNLRNIVLFGTEKAITTALEILTTPEKVLKSKQLPFRFLSAYAEIDKLKSEKEVSAKAKKYLDKVLVGIEKAIHISIQNIPFMSGSTLVLSDNSGSMFGDYGGKSVVSAMSKRTTADIANLFAVICQAKSEKTEIGLFGDRLIKPELNEKKGIFENFKKINDEAKKCGGATETGMFTMFEELIAQKRKVDRIFIFSDCQVGKGCNWFDNKGARGGDFNKLFKQYKEINPAVAVYSVDLRGYGNTLFDEGVMTVGGWSEKIFDLMVACEKGTSVIDEIYKIEL